MAKNPVEFIREVRQEVAKVTWPGRRETGVTTMLVFGFVVVAAVFFLAVDQLVSFAVKLLLGVAG